MAIVFSTFLMLHSRVTLTKRMQKITVDGGVLSLEQLTNCKTASPVQALGFGTFAKMRMLS